MTHPFTMASMFWLDPNSTPEQIRAELREVRANRITLIRIFFFWENVEMRQGEFSFANYDALFSAAAENGIRIMATLGTYLPIWLKSELNKKGIDDSGRRYPCFDRPEVREPLRKFVETVVKRYRNETALAYWNLWNEPTKNACMCPSTLPLFADWLKKRYPDIASLRNAWCGEGSFFSSLCPESFEELTAEWLKTAFQNGWAPPDGSRECSTTGCSSP